MKIIQKTKQITKLMKQFRFMNILMLVFVLLDGHNIMVKN